MNGLDLLIIICIAIGLIKGLFDGIVKQVISLVSLVLAIFFAGTIAKPFREFLFKQSFIKNEIPDNIITGICYILAFAAIIFAFYWLGKLLHSAINVTPAKGLNHLLGGFLGAFKWIFILSLTFVCLTIFDPGHKFLNKQTCQKSVLFNTVRSVVPTLYPYVKDYFTIHNS